MLITKFADGRKKILIRPERNLQAQPKIIKKMIDIYQQKRKLS
jgi:hypothetical protein